MQTFLPYADFSTSASVLDRARLGKQRVETLQILKALSDPDYGWQHHPATQMWRESPASLIAYGQAVCLEWRSRGYKDTCLDKITDMSAHFDSDSRSPWWLGDERLHESHRAMLCKKDPEFYGHFVAEFSPDIVDYWWPTKTPLLTAG